MSRKTILQHLLTAHRHPFSSSLSTATATDLLLRLSTVLYQQQHASDAKLHSHLLRLPLPSSPSSLHHLLLQICLRFPSNWRPPHRFHLFLVSHHPSSFSLSPVAAAKLLDVFARSRNVDLLWHHVRLFAAEGRGLLSLPSLRAAARGFGVSREINKCALLFRLDPQFTTSATLNSVVGELCRRKHVEVAAAVVSKLREAIPADEETYKILILGFCRAGDLAKAARMWNRMVEAGLEPKVEAYEEIVVTLFKSNRLHEAMRVFKSMKERRFRDLGIEFYRVVIQWMCKEGRNSYAYMMFAEMLKRGIGFDNATVGHLIYGLLAKRRVNEAYKVFKEAEEVDVSLCHGMIKGLLRMRRAAAATEVLRMMVQRGVEPNMHTYIMLLQGHMGKKGRKGRDGLVNFESIFVGGLVKAGKTLETTKYAERAIHGAVEVPRFDYNKFLKLFSNEEGVEMFEGVGRRLKEVGMMDLGDVFLVYGERMATRDRRRKAMWSSKECCELGSNISCA